MFENRSTFDPNSHSKMPLKRTPMVLALRGLMLMAGLLFSKHPEDCWTWIRSMVARRRPLSLPIPWLTFDAIRAVSSTLSPNWTVFEFGSGHSTLYWRKFGMSVVSVENDLDWYSYLLKALHGDQSTNTKVIYAGTKAAYVESIDECGASGFDLILVDGAYRRECVLVAVKHVRPAGYLVVDNTDWHWLVDNPYEGIPSNWVKKVYAGYAPMIGHRSETTIWQRPLE